MCADRRRVRRVIPWSVLRNAIRTQPKKKKVPNIVIPSLRSRFAETASVVELSSLAREPSAESPWTDSRGDAEYAERSGPRYPSLSSATRSLPPRPLQFQEAAEARRSEAQGCDPKGEELGQPWPIMGKILRNCQRVTNYLAETDYPPTSLVSVPMARAPVRRAPQATLTLRENLRGLKQLSGLSYDTIAEQGGKTKVFGRTINNLESGLNTGVDTVGVASEGLSVPAWQLFIPQITELSASERQELAAIVQSYVSGGSAIRKALSGIVAHLMNASKEVQPLPRARSR